MWFLCGLCGLRTNRPFELFFSKTTKEDLRLRFFSYVRDFSHKFIARLTQIDYARDMAFCAFDSSGELIGVVRLHADPERETGEYAILLRSDLKGQGLGWALMQLVIEYGQAERLQAHRRPGSLREHDHARYVPGSRLSGSPRSRRAGDHASQARLG
jgi:RimJ/RimL family protein N-acetyltransferase